MEKYSKKLVSKCIYIQILKNTEAELLDQFMSLGGWTLVYQWLHDGNESKNWPFVTEILEMFLLCPVESSRLKLNKTPVIVKELNDNPPNQTVKQLASRLVKQWLEIALNDQQKSQENKPPHNGLNGTADLTNNANKIVIKKEKDAKTTAEEVKYKISNKDSNGKLLLSLKRSTSPSTDSIKEPKIPKIEPNGVVKEEPSEKSSSSKSKDDKKKSSSSSSSHKSSSKSSHRDKERSSSSHKSSSSSSSKDKDKHHKSSHSSKSSSSSSSSSRDKSRDKDKERERRKKEEKEKAEKAQAEKDKETLSFLQPTTSVKLQKIPKRQHSENGDAKPPAAEPVEKKKPSISIEVRTDKPKTVKTLHSQFRDHGLAAEAPKPPSRRDIKKPGSAPSQIIASAFAPQPKPVVPTVVAAAAVTSPTTVSPPHIKKQLEKALDIDNIPERVGGVKLIKPKRKYRQNTDNKSLLISLQAYLLI